MRRETWEGTVENADDLRLLQDEATRA